MIYRLAQLESLVTANLQDEKVEQKQLQIIHVPYRVNPLGAHVDHQGGAVLARAIDLYTVLAFRPFSKPVIQLTFCSPTPPHPTAQFEIGERTEATGWQRYAEAAAAVLHQFRPLTVGLQGAVGGSLLGAGLSSSASVLLAYLRALAQLNGFTLTPDEQVELVRRAENEQLGLNSGVQDQMSIVYGRSNALVHLETRQRQAALIPDPPDAQQKVSWILFYSGFSRTLLGSGFNDRVADCRQAAGLLHEGAKVLGDVPLPKRREAALETLPPHLARRARHFFGETARVAAGHTAWQAGDWATFGNLMNDSCHSSITQYESGSEPLIALQNIMLTIKGVYGSRFCGGGYGGCLVALVEKSQAEDIMSISMSTYLSTYPEKRGIATAIKLHASGEKDG